ncbi:hypothetical protein LEN26_019740 [Aphanomyces euteiches]|nr:hypothetical protein LEN26_019740 [Aphanomyces euteiches]
MMKEQGRPSPPVRKPRQTKAKADAKKAEAAAVVTQVHIEQTTQETTSVESKSQSKTEVTSSDTHKEKGNPDVLSPVSKLEMAREIAAKEQQERIALASARHTEEGRRKSLKRKEVESDIVMPEKVPKIRPDTDDDEVQVIESTTVMHTTSTLTHRRQGKKIEKLEGESSTAYALRAAKIRKEERSHHGEEETVIEKENQPPTAYELKQQGLPSDNIYEKPNVEFVNNVVKDTTTRSAKLEEEPAAVAVEQPQTTRFYVHLAVMLVVVFTVLLGLTELYLSQLPFCNTVADNDFNCRPCPEHGICVGGELDNCEESFLVLGEECKAAALVKQDSTQMSEMVEAILSKAATEAYCKDSFITRVIILDWTKPVQDAEAVDVVFTTEGLATRLRQHPIWAPVGPRTYGMVFKKTLQKLNITTDTIPVTLNHATIGCQASSLAIQYFPIWASVLLVLTGFVVSYWDQKQSEADAELLHKMFCLVQDELIVHANSHEDDKRYAAAFLKNHVLDLMKLTKAEKSRVDSVLWSQLTKFVAREPRIRVTEATDGTSMWEWVSEEQSEPIVGAAPVQVA